ncbi:2905_t:CDS:1, partial [Gigaspora rosea]
MTIDATLVSRLIDTAAGHSRSLPYLLLAGFSELNHSEFRIRHLKVLEKS